ncbi:hypothetical protein GIB67_003588 [Kingdonia uniflora]|uniref:Armadillo-like repeats domain-containing protein n=1 Tax=Kingdonia uniflora TaxID=39325 RepID=A0A7J7MF95_9MAGN|nr:hypothetical protein GIB67_003588 [Kingdonia uniflora]
MASSSSSSFVIRPSNASVAANLRHTSSSLYPILPIRLRRSQTLSSFSSVRLVSTKAKARNEQTPTIQQQQKNPKTSVVEEETEEEEEELPWIQEKAMDLVEFTGSVSQALPGPRVGESKLPWLLAVPLAYAGITFVVAFVKTVRKFNSPKEKRRKLVNKNAFLCQSVDELFQKGRDEVQNSALITLTQKNSKHMIMDHYDIFYELFGLRIFFSSFVKDEIETGFGLEEILRKYIRYTLNEKPFNANVVADLIQLRKSSMLDDAQVAQILNEISRRIVRDKGPVVMNISGYSEKGFKRKLAVQALFGKIFYLSELPEFCSNDSSLIIKDMFGVTDEDAVALRTHTLSEAGDVDSLEKMLGGSDTEESDDEPSDVSQN